MNGFLQNGDFNANSMDGDNNQHANNAMMMMGQDDMGGGMMGGQSLDEIVNLNAKAMRRSSMTQQQPYGGQQNTDPDADMRRISGMMDYNGASPAGPMGNFQFDPNAGGSQRGMMSGNGTPAHPLQRQNISRHQSNNTDISLQTSFADAGRNFNPMMPTAGSYQSPAHPNTSYDMSMNSPYVDPSLGMQMEYMDQSMGKPNPLNQQQLNMFNQQQQFNQGMMQSPMHYGGSQTPLSARPQPQDPGGGGGRSISYQAASSRPANAAQALSRSQSMRASTQTSPAHQGMPSNPQSALSAPQSQHMTGYSEPMQDASQDQELGNASRREFDGLNGPVHPVQIDPSTHNPNNQRFDWDAPEGGWPSTMSGRPHMQTTYKNAYSSSGFDMLGVLVGFEWNRPHTDPVLTSSSSRCGLPLVPIPRSTLARWICPALSSCAMRSETTVP